MGTLYNNVKEQSIAMTSFFWPIKNAVKVHVVKSIGWHGYIVKATESLYQMSQTNFICYKEVHFFFATLF